MIDRKNRRQGAAIACLLGLIGLGLTPSCANMASPEGGPIDVTPPRVVRATPERASLGVKKKSIVLKFDENIKLKDYTKQLVISPRQEETPIVSAVGKTLRIELQDSLKPNTTYSFYFGNSIVDNNEENELEDYYYLFSTGDRLDSLRLSGYVLDAETLEPIDGATLGAYLSKGYTDSLPMKEPLFYISQSNKQGRFTLYGLPSDSLRLLAMADNDRDGIYSSSEGVAWLTESFLPSKKDTLRGDTIKIDSIVKRDTLWRDTLVERAVTEYSPRDIVLRFSRPENRRRGLERSERLDEHRFRLSFIEEQPELPQLSLLGEQGSDGAQPFIPLREAQSITYYIRDTLLSSQDSILLSCRYKQTDSLYNIEERVDTLTLYKPRRERDNVQADSLLRVKILSSKTLWAGTGRDSLFLELSEPVDSLPLRAITLEATEVGDSIPKAVPFDLEPMVLDPLRYIIKTPLELGKTYHARLDSASLYSIYGLANAPEKLEVKMKAEADLGALSMLIDSPDSLLVVELLGKTGEPLLQLKPAKAATDSLSVDSLEAGGLWQIVIKDLPVETYYLRAFVDSNRDGKWTSGLYPSREPEVMYYYPEVLPVKKGFTTEERWTPLALPLYQQKPKEIRKVKEEEPRKKVDKNKEYQERMRKKFG